MYVLEERVHSAGGADLKQLSKCVLKKKLSKCGVYLYVLLAQQQRQLYVWGHDCVSASLIVKLLACLCML
jgi:hypothetical protein